MLVVVYVGAGYWVGGPITYFVVVVCSICYCLGSTGYYYVFVCCLRVSSCFYLSLLLPIGRLICFRSVCYNYLIVVVGKVVVVYGFTVDTYVILVPDYGLVSLAADYMFDMCLFASRAFSICIYRARISSALSMYMSSSVGSTNIVTDLVKAGFLPAFYCDYVSAIGVCLLDDGIALLCAFSFCFVLSTT
jgi:hypothetical protein